MITGISSSLYHIQRTTKQEKLSELTDPQKQIWEEFLSENKSGRVKESDYLASEPDRLTSSAALHIFSFGPGRFLSFNPEVEHPSFETCDKIIPSASEGRDSETRAALVERETEGMHPAQRNVSIDEIRPHSIVDHHDIISGYAKSPRLETEMVVDTLAEKLVNLTGNFLTEESPITSDWLAEHLGVAKLFSTFPEFAEYLNENNDLAQNFMESIDAVKAILEDFFDANAVEKAGELLSDDSAITDEWLAENLGAAHFIAKHPAFAIYLNENVEQAEKFISVSV